MARALFPSLLGEKFLTLESPIQWVHGGLPRQLGGSATVQRGASIAARILGALASLPPTMVEAPLRVRIDVTRDGERWTRWFGASRPMISTLREGRCLLIEQLGPAALTFRVNVRGSGLEWTLERIAVLGMSLPVRWFAIRARIEAREERYHFTVDAALRKVGPIVRYEGYLHVRD